MVGDKIPIIARATLIHNGNLLTLERSVIAEYQAGFAGSHWAQQESAGIFSELQYWKQGDQHVHTRHSESDGAYVLPWIPPWIPPSIEEQAEAGSLIGLSWIIITDHESMLNTNEWLNEVVPECSEAESTVGIKVMPGEEVGSVTPIISHGHYLAYGINSFVEWDGTAQAMITEVENQGGFGFIAHPYSSLYGWDDWSVSGYQGLEIMNGPTASDDAINKWNQILENPAARIFGIGDSDAHWPVDIGSAVTYCYIEGAVTHSSIYSALKNGHCVLSNGPLIAFGIGDKKIGDTVNIAETETVLDIAWESTQFGAIQRIEVYANNGLIKTITDVSGTTGSTSKTIDVNPQTLYVRLRGIFLNGEAYTNTIWVCVNAVVGETRDVNANLVTNAVVSLYEYGDGLYGSDVASPDYCIEVDQTGDYWLSASKSDFTTVKTNNLPPYRNPYHPDYIDFTTPELLAVGYCLDFEGDYGLVPRACNLSYAMTSINHWLFVPIDASEVEHPEWQLSSWKAMESVHSWQFPS